MPERHALLGASSSHRWLKCPPSALLESKEPEQTSPYAQEGTEAHAEASEFLVGHKTGEPEHDIKLYLDYVQNTLDKLTKEGKNPQLMVEVELTFDEWVPEGFGTGDAVIVYDGGIEIIDLKYGKGVVVSAKNNSQLRLYALGVYQTFYGIYDFDSVRTTIVQSRLDAISSDEITIEDLLVFADNVKKVATVAFKGKGSFCVGDHCQFCKIAGKCKARKEALTGSIKPYIRKNKNELTLEDVGAILPSLDALDKWIKDIREFAISALAEGHKIPGYKLVEGKSNRKYTDTLKVASRLKEAGYDEAVIYKKELLGITDMEKLVGKKAFTELLSGLIVKPAGKASLAPEDDPRPAMYNAQSQVIIDVMKDD